MDTKWPKEVKTTPIQELLKEPEPVEPLRAEAKTPEIDPKEALRQRIEAEELAKFEEEQMRAEIRRRLMSENATPVDSATAPTTYAPHGSQAPIIVNVNNTNSNVNTNNNNASVEGFLRAERKSPALILRILYFIVFGWWVGPLWLAAAFFLCITVIGLPIGLLMLRRSIEAFIL